MQLIKTLSVMALATGVVVAIPANVEKRQWTGGNRWWQRPGDNAVITVTGYDAEPTNWGDTPASTPTSTVEAQVTATPTPDTNWSNQGPPADSSPTETWAEPTSSPEPTPADTGSSQNDYMAVVSKWRAAGGLPGLTQDSLLEGNALKTSTNSVGGLIHELNPGTFAQVLAPGTPDNFESVYVGGWLCEIPSLPGLNGICSTESQGWDHSDGETGHAEILTSTSYTKIGCALSSSTGVWACDLA